MLELPEKIELPLFAYGLFKPGQLAFFQLRDFVSSVSDNVEIMGSLRLRDGLPIIDPETKRETVPGALVTFKQEHATEAYKCISEMEPDQHYRWNEVQINGDCCSANVLVGKSPQKGSVPFEEGGWNGWTDPLFTDALDVVEETLNSQVFDGDFKPLFKLQMAYLLLWSSIERYVSLRYNLGEEIMGAVKQLANEPAFKESLSLYVDVDETREVYRANRPREKYLLIPHNPKKAIDYYYQVRCNITHRGKGAHRDFELLEMSLKELLPIFRHVLQTAERDARYPS